MRLNGIGSITRDVWTRPSLSLHLWGLFKHPLTCLRSHSLIASATISCCDQGFRLLIFRSIAARARSSTSNCGSRNVCGTSTGSGISALLPKDFPPYQALVQFHLNVCLYAAKTADQNSRAVTIFFGQES